MMIRYVASMPPGIAVTAGLLFLMQYLIAGGVNPVQQGLEPPHTIWRQVDPVTPPPPPESHTPKRIPPPATTPGTGPSLLPPEATTTRGLPSLPAPPEPGQEIGDPIAWSDSPLGAAVRVQPLYPPRLAALGIEGFVTVRFDVGADGRVSNVAVVQTSDRRFNRSAVHAAGRFRYQPRVVDGTPVATPGVQTVFRFKLEDGDAKIARH